MIEKCARNSQEALQMAKETQDMVKKILALKNEDEHVDKIVHADDVKAIKKKRKQNIESFSWYYVSIYYYFIHV